MIGALSSWPESLHEYADRCFAECEDNFDRDQMENHLRSITNQATQRGVLWNKDWENEPIPSVQSKRNSELTQRQPNQSVSGQAVGFP